MRKIRGFSVKMSGSNEAEVCIYSEIGGPYGVTAKEVRDELAKYKGLSTIRVRIHSPGGDVLDGLAIYNTLKNHKARVIVHIDGAAISMASIIAMAGDEIEAAKNSWMMIHNPWTVAAGDAADMRHTADLLEKMQNQIGGIYEERTGQPKDKILALLNAETWLTADEAADLGFVDRVTDDTAISASIETSRFANVPERFKNQFNFLTLGETIMEPNSKTNDTTTAMMPQGSVTPPPLPTTPTTATATIPASASQYQQADGAFDVTAYRQAHAAETARINDIRKLCADHGDIETKAIAEGWTTDKTELEVMRASRSTGPAIHSRGGKSPTQKTLEAGLLLSMMHPEASLVRAYGADTVEQGHAFRRLRINELIDLCLMMEGRQALGIGAADSARIKMGFSTISLPGILSNIAHKVMLEAYTAVPGVAKMLCKPLTATDFKEHTGYRVSGDMKFEEVGPDGELKHGKLDEQSYTYSIDTYGKMFGLTRKMQINDDLGAFAEIPRIIGRGCALMEERMFWTLVLNNTNNFFHANNENLITKVLGSAGLGLAVKALVEQVDKQSDPILVMGKYLVVPPALQTTADELYQSTNVNTGGASTSEKVPDKNIWANRYQPVMSPYPGSTAFNANASSTKWWLWGDPADVAAFGFANLNGQTGPIIEEVPLSGEFLGQAWRGYRDCGVCQIDPAGAVQSNGTTA